MLKKDKKNLVWIDLEMTGLDAQHDHIIEIATIVTDQYLQHWQEGPSLVIHQADEILDNMNEWCQQQHGNSGLTQRVRDSQCSLASAEQQTLGFISQYCEAGSSPLCGNSIGTDRRFMAAYMPTLEQFFHYRNVDVSTIKELALRWRPELAGQVKKNSSHLALDDIKDSIEELQFYRRHWLS